MATRKTAAIASQRGINVVAGLLIVQVLFRNSLFDNHSFDEVSGCVCATTAESGGHRCGQWVFEPCYKRRCMRVSITCADCVLSGRANMTVLRGSMTPCTAVTLPLLLDVETLSTDTVRRRGGAAYTGGAAIASEGAMEPRDRKT